jgi:hypothetical protein
VISINNQGLLPLLQKISFPLLCIVLFLLCAWVYASAALRLASLDGVYHSAEEAMLARIDRNYEPLRPRSPAAPTRSMAATARLVCIACVWGNKRMDGTQVGSERHAYDQPGSFFLHTKDGWVLMPEGAFPTFIGFWMKVYGLDGPAVPQPSHPMGSGGRCVF